MSSAIFIGAVDISLKALQRLVNLDFPVSAVITLPENNRNRHSDYVNLGSFAKSNRIQFFTTENINSPDSINFIKALDPDYIFCIGWSQILSHEILRTPKNGCVGFHPSALPKNRGRAAIPWTILLGDTKTSGTLFWLDKGVDSGDILIQKNISLDVNETAKSLYEKHIYCLEEMLGKVSNRLLNGDLPRTAQNHAKATYCSKRIRTDGLIDWDLPAYNIWTLIRATTKPYPGAFSFYDNKEIIIWEADLFSDTVFNGIPGQIQDIDKGGAIISCGGSSLLAIRRVQFLGQDESDPSNVFKVHTRMGIPKYALASAINTHNKK